ncbi:MAG: oligosaccharide flippase family protein [Polyangiales bacterium]
MPDGPAPAESLTRRILSETSRFAALQAANAGLGWGAQVVLARLLDQRDFGVYGICTFYIGIGQLLGDGGLGATLLRRKAAATLEEYRATVTSLLGLAGLFALGLWIAAPIIAAKNHFTAHETWALRVMAPLYFVGAFRVAPYVRLERELRFGAIARIELAAQAFKHLVALSLAAADGGLWALVVSELCGSALRLAAAYRTAPGWVGLGWTWRAFQPLIAYGSKVQAIALCAYVKDNLSRALLGTLLGPAAVGLYDFGLGYIQIPVIAVNGLARVQLPVYARFDIDDPALYNTLRGAIRTALLLGLPFLGLLAWTAPWLIEALYGAKWTPSQPVVWGLLLNMACSLTLSPLFTLLQAQGHAGQALKVFTLWTTGTWLASLAGYHLGQGQLGPIAAAASCTTLLVTTYLFRWVRQHLARDLFGDTRNLIAAGLLALGAAALANTQRQHPVVLAALFVAVYVFTVYALERQQIVAELNALTAALKSRNPSRVAAPS